MSQAWLHTKERGSLLGLKLMSWLTRLLGRRAGRMLVYPICLYFYVFSRSGVRASRAYLNRVLGRPATARDVLHHFYTFGVVLLDRVYFHTGQVKRLRFTSRSPDAREYINRHKGQGALFIGSHLGSFDMAQAFASDAIDLHVHMMMYEDNAKKFRRIREYLGVERAVNAISLGGVDSLLRAKDVVEQGGAVAMLGDRIMDAERTVRVPFLGADASFPVGPILAAHMLQAPVVLFFGLYQGDNRYDGYFEVFADRIELSRDHRMQDAEQWVRRYVARLEHYCRLAPFNWFNLYDYWGTEVARHE